MNSSYYLSLLGTLDPIYTLLPNRPRLVHSDLRAYLRLHHLLLGSFVVPRTYLIHGLRNPCFDLSKSGKRGKEELRDFVQNAGIIVSGHNKPEFSTLDGHLRITIEEDHPLVYEQHERLAYASELQEWLPPESVVLQEVTKVIANFPAVFKKYFLQYADQEAFASLDLTLKALLTVRNPKNKVKFADGVWGRNEVCDHLLNLPAEDPKGGRLANCAVAAYQETFAGTFPKDLRVFLNSGSLPHRPLSSEDLARRLQTEMTTSGPLEIDLDLLSSRTWHEISEVSVGIAGERNEFVKGLVAKDKYRALDALGQLVDLLRKEYPPKGNGLTAHLRMILDTAKDPTVGVFIDWVGSKVQHDMQSCILGIQRSLMAIEEAYARIQNLSRDRRQLEFHLDYLYDFEATPSTPTKVDR